MRSTNPRHLPATDARPPPAGTPGVLSDAASGTYERRDALPSVNIYLPEGEASIRLRKLIRNVLFESQIDYEFVNGDISTFLRYKYYARNYTYRIGVFDSIEFPDLTSDSDKEFERVRGGLLLIGVPKDYNNRYFFLLQDDRLTFGDTDRPDDQQEQHLHEGRLSVRHAVRRADERHRRRAARPHHARADGVPRHRPAAYRPGRGDHAGRHGGHRRLHVHEVRSGRAAPLRSHRRRRSSSRACTSARSSSRDVVDPAAGAAGPRRTTARSIRLRSGRSTTSRSTSCSGSAGARRSSRSPPTKTRSARRRSISRTSCSCRSSATRTTSSARCYWNTLYGIGYVGVGAVGFDDRATRLGDPRRRRRHRHRVRDHVRRLRRLPQRAGRAHDPGNRTTIDRRHESAVRDSDGAVRPWTCQSTTSTTKKRGPVTGPAFHVSSCS